ncbi:MAG: hypothetical protein A3D52_01705 [Candidatus Taylorbacteria bacterium RIFCSPHIGHO2_02_FULL_44_36]|uniref:Uncharacterized protein n=1 Tax=Candidatus Taylorbacteria bacterium RIFCSPLOWO2_12_FULL_44_15c TaxID=1802333 RepID=A0A1G2P6C2_9BACT|nr:MAG: hypothetical protein A3D52_01705 [Candidatus Taylorbacteria bacterium RIFCSPHIGHO2_02_FULL_44_36]OHA38604.1 MAG: hypothetical protein A3I97_01065 [Candidatus Taylorbacteria bacterium RIFCSPLOWO2_02_FULL_44_35]OHA43888.1 MAG: hypothetical protein A3G03_01095 [Candidatus Taylorbacteria bacterium RIFCSPLOWO2_12_FULL_44_15c]
MTGGFEVPRRWSDFVGEDAEQAYAEVFKAGPPRGGHGDKGLDVPTGDSEVPFVQVKSSIKGVMDFFRESTRRKEFIPICIGEPGEREEMLSTLKKFGAWIAKDIPDRENFFEQISTFKTKLERSV